ncbi:MAG: methylhydantoinase [Thaumarchaeota archaeon]|nr:methylhydantoinase [Nitrososphaerota archaeon]
MMQQNNHRVRIGIDVGGTFTKAVALDTITGDILAKSTIPTTHFAKTGVSEGILDALHNTIKESGINPHDIELISHSTTQAINALLESDTAKVGIIAMGVGPEKKDVINRTDLHDTSINPEHDIKSCHAFLDTSHLITTDEVQSAIRDLQDKGAKVIVATESFGVDDPSNEEFVMKTASELDVLSTASHEVSGTYGLEIRTLTAVINASVIPKTFQVARFVEDTICNSGITAPLMIMKGDGGVTSMDTFKTKPILTILSGPAASVAGALLYLRITNGIFVEVGGTSTNICTIKNGRPEFKYVTIRDHPTCVRSMDVRVLGVAGGSMVNMQNNRVWRVGPRSAHIAGLKYACFAEPDVLRAGKIVMIKPRESDDEYVAIQCKDDTFAITNTCAANALGLVDKDDYSYANQESAKIAMDMLARYAGMSSFAEIAQSIINTASFDIMKTITKIIQEFKLDSNSVQVIGGGGGASVLVPFVAKQLQLQYVKAKHADVISSIGVASSMLQEELEQSMVNPTPEQINIAHKKIHTVMVEKGAVPESIVIDSQYIAEKSILRITASGNVNLDSSETSRSVFTLDDLKCRASEILCMPKDSIDLGFESDHYAIFVGHVAEKRLFGKKNRHPFLVLDRFGRMKKSVKNGKIFQGGKISILEDLDDYLESRGGDVAPQIYLVNDLKLVDYSGLTSPNHILDAIRQELDENERAAILVEF